MKSFILINHNLYTFTIFIISSNSEWRSRGHTAGPVHCFRIKQRASWHSGEIHTAGLLLWHTWMTEPLSVMISMNCFPVYITTHWGKNINRFSMINRKKVITFPHTQKHTWQKQITVYKSLSNCKKKSLLPYKWIMAFPYFMPLITAWLGKTILLITCFVFLENKFWC